MRLRVPASLKICEDRHIKGPLQGGDHYPGSDPRGCFCELAEVSRGHGSSSYRYSERHVHGQGGSGSHLLIGIDKPLLAEKEGDMQVRLEVLEHAACPT